MIEHSSVLLKESIQGLNIVPDGTYVDATFGRGGHSKEILNCLSAGGKLIVIDKDPIAISVAEKLQEEDDRVIIYHGSFADIYDVCKKFNVIGKVNGVLADLGVSSPQLDQRERGFSFMKDGPLDMRMDTSTGITAAQWLATAKEEDIANTIFEYGEERFSRRIARSIVSVRDEEEISTTLQLAEIVSKAVPRKEKHKHPATRTFQAIRIKINNELKDLEQFLPDAIKVMGKGGRLSVISFHSLEDRAVKRFIQKMSQADDLPKDIPVRSVDLQADLKKVGKAIKPCASEIEINVRARSAILRVAEKLID